MSAQPSLSNRDSIAALDALLKLNASKEGQLTSRSNLSSALGLINDAIIPGISGLSATYDSALASSLTLAGFGIHPHLDGYFLPSKSPSMSQISLSASRLVAAQAAAAFVPSTPAPSLSQHTQAAQNSAASGDVNAAAPFSSASFKKASSARLPGVDSPTKGYVPQSSGTAPVIRKKKVEEALRSKPQRGKRREDLSDKERMELTRTRNREHAKSTRLRKKARYQVLLDCEEQVRKFHQAESLRQERRGAIEKFLRLRQEMLNESIPLMSLSVSTMENLEALVDQSGTFQYNIHGQNEFASQDSACDMETTNPRRFAALRMAQWDRNIKELCQASIVDKEQNAETNTPSFQYMLADGVDGVAISENGTGFARVNIVLRGIQELPSGSSPKLVLSGIFTIQFTSTSSRFSSVTWTTSEHPQSVSGPLSRRNDEPQTVTAVAGALVVVDPSCFSNALENQMIHPSVVSLDIKALNAEGTDTNHGPGMAI